MKIPSLLHALAKRRRNSRSTRFASTWYSAPIGLAFGTQDGIVLDVNPAFEQILGRSAREICGRTFLAFTHPDDVGISVTSRQKLQRPGDRIAYEKRFVRPDGADVWTRVSLHLARGAKGQDLYIIGTVEDIAHRKAAEDEAECARREVLEILDLAPEAVFIAAPDLRCLDANPRALELTGYTRDELRAVSISELTEPSSEPLDRDGLLSGKRIVVERVLKRRDGTGIPVEIAIRRLPGGRLLAFARDMTSRNNASMLLRRSEARFRRIFETDTVGIAFWRWDGTVADANEAYLTMTGYDLDDLKAGRIRWNELPANPEDAATLERMLDELRRVGFSGAYARTYRRRDGTAIRALTSAATLADDVYDGVSILIDIEERENAIESLRQSEERFRELIERSHDMTAVLDVQGRYLYHSPSVNKVLGYAHEDLVGKNAFDFMHPADVDLVRRTFQRAIVQNRETEELEYRFRAADGSWRWLHSVGSNLLGSPAIRGIVTNSRDVTDRRRLGDAVERAERVARLGRLAATMAHEFNNVLMSIQPFTEILRKPDATAQETERAITHIRTAVQRGKRVTAEILRFTQAGDPVLAAMDVGQWLRELAEELDPSLGNRISLGVESEDDLFIEGDRSQLSQVVINIVVNARDALDDGGTILIRAERAESGTGSALVAIRVRDDGPGIPGSMLDSIFDPLFTTKKGGTGLGLPVAQQLVLKHGGDLHVVSTPGKGTEFTILLPAGARGPEYESPSDVAGEVPPNLRILLVEDEVAVAEGVAALLELEGHQTRIVDLGGAAEQAIEEFSPDVTILDIGLPDIDGIELYERLVTRHPSIAYIIASGHLLEAGNALPRSVTFIQKPYEMKELLGAIAGALKVGE